MSSLKTGITTAAVDELSSPHTEVLLFLQGFGEGRLEFCRVFLLERTFLIAGYTLLTDDILAARLVPLPHWREVCIALDARERVEDILDLFLLGGENILDYLLRNENIGYSQLGYNWLCLC